jgi:hypothetical protein
MENVYLTQATLALIYALIVVAVPMTISLGRQVSK